MPILAILILVFSAMMHTAWNILLKQTGEKYISTWWATLLGALLFIPFIYFSGLPSREVWGLLAASILLETVYYVVLATAYRDADFSLVYPFARGSAPALIAIWSALFLSERLTPGGIIGLGIITLGLFILGGSDFFSRNKSAVHLRGILFAFGLALTISLYSILDGIAIHHTRALAYGVLIFIGPPLLTAPLLFRVYGWGKIRDHFSRNRYILPLIGFMIVGAYLLVLSVYSFAPVSYSGAVRECSVVIGAFAGWYFLKEPLGKWRLLGSLVIFAGILVVAFWA